MDAAKATQDQPLGKLLWLCYGVAILLIGLDQVTKIAADNMLTYGQPVVVLPIFNLTLLYNTGAAFSFLSDAGGWQRYFFTIVASVVSLVMIVWLSRLKRSQYFLAIGLTGVLAGAIGNLIDRVIYGHVVDFLSFHWGPHYFPAFNVADMAISAGALFLILDAFFGPKEED